VRSRSGGHRSYQSLEEETVGLPEKFWPFLEVNLVTLINQNSIVVGVEMEDIYFTDQNRSQLENRILELAESVPVGDPNWPHSQQLYQFIDAWYDLGRYYAAHTDTVIGMEIVSEYVNFARLLRRLISDSTLDHKLRQQAEDRMRDLESAIDKVIFEAGSNLNN
jgi:hypothetical protein